MVVKREGGLLDRWGGRQRDSDMRLAVVYRLEGAMDLGVTVSSYSETQVRT